MRSRRITGKHIIPGPKEFFSSLSRFFNLDDAQFYVPKVTGLLKRNDPSEIISHLQQIRFEPDQDWIWYLSLTRIFLGDLEEKPLLFLSVFMPVNSKGDQRKALSLRNNSRYPQTQPEEKTERPIYRCPDKACAGV